MKLYTHWIKLDPIVDVDLARRAFREGSRYAVRRVYNHSDGIHMVFEVLSPDPYQDLQLDIESLTSPLKRYSRKPAHLGKGITLKQFEGIYGPMDAPTEEDIWNWERHES